MKLNLIKIAFRNLLKDRVYTFINLMGLTLGISFSFLIYIYVKHQLSYDQHIPQAENVYRILADFDINGQRQIYSNGPRPLGGTLVNEFPSITHSVKLFGYNGLLRHEGLLWNQDKYTSSSKVFLADTSFFEVFQLPLIEGNAKTALKEPNSIVIAQSLAQNLFGNVSAIGKAIRLESDADVVVTGVFEDMDLPTHLPMEAIISYYTYFTPNADSELWWYGAHVYTYVKTTDNFNPNDIHDNWQPFFEKYMKETFDFLDGSAKVIFQPITSIYLDQEYIWEPYPHGSRQNVYIFSIIGIFLLIVAGFNYTNLTLSRSLSRSKEVGVRKSLGASKNSIRVQFLVESTVTALVAAIISISFISVILPTFNYLTQQDLSFSFIQKPIELLVLFLIGLVIGVLSGLYPAMYISSFQIASVLKSIKSATPKQSVSIRKLLVVVQQVISIVLIICTLVVIDQLNFVREMDSGFDKENLIIINVRDSVIQKQIEVFGQDLKNIVGVDEVSSTNDTPETGINEYSFDIKNRDGKFELTPTQVMEVGLNFVNTMGMKLIAGRYLNENDVQFKSLIINRFLAEKMGYTPEEAIGVQFRFPDEEDIERTIIGVIENVMVNAPTEPAQSLSIALVEESRFLVLRVEKERQQEVLLATQKLWKNYGSTFPFNYSFLDDQLDSLLGKENRLYNLLVFGSFLIIFISCLGLFGLVSYTAIQRTKEIGIRKVLGAKVSTLFFVMIRDFLSSSFIAILIASGLAWYIGSSWLENFVYRTNFEWNNIVFAGVISLAITLFALSYHTFQVIKTNPVDSLKE